MPWPISTFGMTRRTAPSLSIRMNALGAKAGLPSATAAAVSPGWRRALMIAPASRGPPIRKKASDRPAPALSTRRRGRSRLSSVEDDIADSVMAGLRRRRGKSLGDLQLAGRSLLDCRADAHVGRSEEHTSELQSRLHLVCRLLLEKKKKNKSNIVYH